MSQPSVATIKRLFSVSKNQCAFSKCTTFLVDPMSGKVTGRICHIKGQKPGGPRYDKNQLEEDRHAFDNLILMCPIHHDVIDSDEESYTVKRLTQIKTEHEKEASEINDVPDSTVKGFINNVHSNTINHGSLVFTQNQMGGQTAHSIINIGKQPRQISQAAANALIADLRKFPLEKFIITGVLGDSESMNTAEMIKNILNDSGSWNANEVAQGIFHPPLNNIIFEVSSPKENYLLLLNWFDQIGFKPQGILDPALKFPNIMVGSNT